jgi:hypothetical protein
VNYILKTLLKYDININLPPDIPTPPEAGDFGGGGGGGDDDGPPPPGPPGRPSSSASDDGGGPAASGAGRRNNGPAAGTNDWYCSSSGVLYVLWFRIGFFLDCSVFRIRDILVRIRIPRVRTSD